MRDHREARSTIFRRLQFKN